MRTRRVYLVVGRWKSMYSSTEYIKTRIYVTKSGAEFRKHAWEKGLAYDGHDQVSVTPAQEVVIIPSAPLSFDNEVEMSPALDDLLRSWAEK